MPFTDEEGLTRRILDLSDGTRTATEVIQEVIGNTPPEHIIRRSMLRLLSSGALELDEDLVVRRVNP